MNVEIKKLRHSKDEADRKKCLQLLEEYLSANPTDAEGWYDKACCHDFIGEEKEAEPCYRKCYELGWQKLLPSEQKSFFVGYGSTLRNNFKYDESVQILEEGIKNFPEAPALQVFLAFTFFSKKMDQKASQILFSATPLIAKFGLDGYERAIQWYADNLLTHPEVRK